MAKAGTIGLSYLAQSALDENKWPKHFGEGRIKSPLSLAVGDRNPFLKSIF